MAEYNLPVGYVSPTQINAFRDCARCYQYAYVDKIPKPASIHFAIGTLAHRAAEVVAQHIIGEARIDVDEALTLAGEAFDKQINEPFDEDGVELALVDLAKYDDLGKAKDAGIKVARHALTTLPKLFKERGIIAAESNLDQLPDEFLAAAFPFPVKGRIDYLYGDKQTMAINAMTDLKTASKRGGPDENGCLQFSFYGLPAHMAGADWRVGADMAIKTATPDFLTYWANGSGYLTDANYDVAREIIIDVAEHISRGDFPIGKGWNGRHDYEHGLGAFSIAVEGYAA